MYKLLSSRWALLVPFCVGAFGCSSPSPSGTLPDSGSPADSGSRDSSVDSTVPTDGGQDTGTSDGQGGDGGAGTLLAQVNSCTLWGVTDDGHVIYTDTGNNNALLSVSLSGGMPQTILGGLGTMSFYVRVKHNAVIAWANIDMTSSLADMYVWTTSSSGQANRINMMGNPTLAYAGDISDDGKYILYFSNFPVPNNIYGDLFGANADGTGAKDLVPMVQLLCSGQPQLGFAGSHAVAWYCPIPDGGGNLVTDTIGSWTAGGSWTGTTITSDAQSGWATDQAGDKLYIQTSAGAQVFPVGGGAPTTIDPTGTFGILTPDGSAAIYVSTSPALMRSPVASPMPITIGPNSQGFYNPSPDGKQILYFTMYDSTTGLTDLLLTSATMAGTPATLATAQSSNIVGSAYTNDSSHAVYFTGYDPGTRMGTLNAFAVGGTQGVVLGTKSYLAWASGNTKVVFLDDLMTGMLSGMHGTGTIKVVDTAASGMPMPTTVVTGANADFYLSPMGDKIVYALNMQAGPMAGIYAAPVP